MIVPPADYFQTWEHERTPKRKGGRVYVDVRATGEVTFHEGYLTRKEARRIEKGEPLETGQKPSRPEVSSIMQSYIDLHRHAAVRAALTAQPQVALRLMVAHAIAGSHLWNVKPEPQTTRNELVAESVETSKAEADFDERRRAVLAVLGFSPEEPRITGGSGGGTTDDGVTALFYRLLDLPDPIVMDIITIVMGETLASGSAVVEAVGLYLGVEMPSCWQADDAFFELIRDREVLIRIVAELAGETVAEANAGEKTKTLKRIVRDHLEGANGRAKVERWVPRWMAFPPSGYTDRGGIGSVAAHAKVAALRDQRQDESPDPTGPAAAPGLPGVDAESETAAASGVMDGRATDRLPPVFSLRNIAPRLLSSISGAALLSVHHCVQLPAAIAAASCF